MQTTSQNTNSRLFISRKINNKSYWERAPGFPSGSSAWEQKGRGRLHPAGPPTLTDEQHRQKDRKENKDRI